ncbi:MAG: universal stress protein [Chloroflexi bacterium]|nr:universal stress protein [Chloroflexota bacterium]
MFQKILVPLDGSELAECVLPHVDVLAAGHEDVKITFLYVIQPLDVPMTNASYKKRIEADAKSSAEEYLNKLVAKAKYRDKAVGKVITGKVADTIVDYATRNKIELIVMATHGRSGASRWLYGSIAEKVLDATRVPVWLVKAGACDKATYANGKKLNVLVPLDGSELAESVLKHLKELNRQLVKNKTDVILIRVCEVFAPPISYPPPMSMSWEEYLDYETRRCKQICQDYLDKIQGSLHRYGLKIRSEVPEGNPAEVLIDYANKNPVDLIIMSTHGRTGINKWAFGSIAEKVLRGARCPILLIRAK